MSFISTTVLLTLSLSVLFVLLVISLLPLNAAIRIERLSLRKSFTLRIAALRMIGFMIFVFRS